MLRKLCVTIASAAALSALVMVSVAGAADKLIVNNSGGSAVFKVDDTGTVIGNKLGMGTTTPQAPLHLNLPTVLGVTPLVGTALYNVSTGFALSTQDNSPAADFTVADGTGTAGYRGTLRGVRSRGSLQSPSIPLTDDYVFSVLGGVYTGGRVWNAADISMKVDGSVSEGASPPDTVSSPVRITFNTRPYGWNWYERMTIKSDGKVGIGATAPTALLDVNSNGIRIENPKTPASSTDTCNQGDLSWDANYVYVCVAANTWKRSALQSF